VDLAQAGERDGEQGEDDEGERDGGEIHGGVRGSVRNLDSEIFSR
jgi:hypothetical protein